MKNLNQAYVIVEQFSSSHYGFFKNFISFDRQEIDKKCEEMNTEENEKIFQIVLLILLIFLKKK